MKTLKNKFMNASKTTQTFILCFLFYFICKSFIKN